jgi:hypothetical protein
MGGIDKMPASTTISTLAHLLRFSGSELAIGWHSRVKNRRIHISIVERELKDGKKV